MNRKITLIGLLATLMSLSTLQAHAGGRDIGQLVVFGDSLSDPGNFFAIYQQEVIAPYVWIPSAPYAIGRMHFSNGATWVEQLARQMHAAGMGPAFGSAAFTNYAVGGARARAGAPSFPYYDLTTQVSQFLSRPTRPASASTLYVVWIGANDERDALIALSGGDVAGAGATLRAAVTATADNVVALWASGARKFLILNAPDFALTPYVTALGPAAQYAAEQITGAYNGGLDQAVTALRALPGISLQTLDANLVLRSVIANRGGGELSNVSAPCLSFNVATQAVCSEPEEYLFWDGIHPTTEGHSFLKDAALKLLAH